MNTRYTLRAVALASVCLAPLAAHAQESDFDVGTAAPAVAAAPVYDNEAEVGIRTQSQTSGVFGRYTGQVNGGVFVFGGFKLQSRDDWKSGGTQYFSLVGKNLDFGGSSANSSNQLSPEASVAVKAGNQGSWGVKASYDAISYAQSTQYSTPFSTKDALPSALRPTVAAGNPAALAEAALYSADSSNLFMGTRRDIYAVGGQYLMDSWTYNADVRHEHKSGFMEQSAGLISTTSGPATFPQQIDTDTDRYGVGMAFNSKRLQAQLGMSLSKFTNNDPYTDVQALMGGTANGGIIPVAQGPSSSATSMNASIAYNFTPATRLNANFAYGIQKQNEPFTSASSNMANFSATNIAELASTPGSLNATVQTYFANIALVSRPLDRLDTKVSYTYDQRWDGTAHFNSCNNLMVSCNGTASGIWGDSGNATSAVAGQSTGLPRVDMSWTKQTAKAEAGYRLFDGVKLSGGLSYQDFQRANYTAVDHTKETTEWLKVSDHFTKDIDGSLGYSHSVRSASDMSGSDTMFNGSVGYLPYYQTGRTQDAVKGRVGYQPIEEAQIGLNGKFTRDHYQIEELDSGMLSDSVLSFGPDIAFEPLKDVTAHVFYNYEQNFHNDQAKLTVTGGAINTQTNDVTHVAGASVDWKPKDEWKLAAEYNFVEGDTYVSSMVANGGSCNSATVSCPIPGIQEQMQSLKLTSAYDIAPNVTWFLRYGLDYMKDNDSAYWVQGVNIIPGATSINAITPTDSAPRYFVNSFSTSVRVKW